MAGTVTRTRLLAAAAASCLACLATTGALAAGPPPGATALCRDGTPSFSATHSGTCSHHGGVATWLDGSSAPPATTPNAVTPAASAPAGAGTRTVLLHARTRTSACARGALPDPRCSPGAVDPALTRAVLCSAGFHTSSVRHVPDSLKHAVEIAYGMVPRAYGRTIEIDHIVSLELGGSNDIANLYPEPGGGTSGYQVKDRLENALHRLVCAGTMTLAAAQRGIATNWLQLYRSVFGATP